MPLQPDGNYTIPDGTFGVADQTVYSARYNGWVNDIATVLNLPRPVNKGGTNATNAADARTNLQVEVRTQAVTNFTAHAWEAGSFHAVVDGTGTNGAPNTTEAFSGICYMLDANNLFVEARGHTSSQKFMRKKLAGVWDGVWTVETGAFVRFDISTQGLTDTQQQNARRNISAAPIDALGYFGLSVNAGMTIAQENLGAAQTISTAGVTLGHLADLYQLTANATGLSWTAQLSGGFATVALGTAININCGAAAASPGAGVASALQHFIEADRSARLWWGTSAASPITIGLFVNSNIAGVLPLSIRNNASDRSYVTPITINSANAWEYKTVTIPGDTAGTWLSAAGSVGLRIAFGLCVGSTFTTGTPNVWQAGNFVGLSGAVNFGGAVNRQIFIAGLLVLPGVHAPLTQYFPNAFRTFSDELPLVQRYWQKSYNYANIPGAGTYSGCYSQGDLALSATGISGLGISSQFKTQMRAAPGTVVVFNPETGASNSLKIFQAALNTSGTPSVFATTERNFMFTVTGSGYSAAAPAEVLWQWAASARF